MLAQHESQTKQNNKNTTDKSPNQFVFGGATKINAQGQKCHYYGIINKMMGWVIPNMIFIRLWFHDFILKFFKDSQNNLFGRKQDF
jgi:hypothetical protein